MTWVMSLRVNRLALVFAACAALSVVGCGGVKLVSVSGHLELADGTPVPDCTVHFWPDVEKGNEYPTMSPIGHTDGSGNFELTTDGRKGAPLGWYKVSLEPGKGTRAALSGAPSAPAQPPPDAVPPPEEPPPGPGKKHKRRPPPPPPEEQPKPQMETRPGIPSRYTNPGRTDLRFQVTEGCGPANFKLSK